MLSLLAGMILLSEHCAVGSDPQQYGDLIGQFQKALHAYEINQQTEEYARLLNATRQPAVILRLMALVDDERAADPGVVDALVWVSKMAPTLGSKEPLLNSAADRARAMLVEKHIEDERIGLALSGIMYLDSGSQAAETLFRAALEKSPHRQVRGRACYWLAMYLKNRAENVCELRLPPEDRLLEQSLEKRWGSDALVRLRAADPEKSREEAEALFERAIRDYGDVLEFGMKNGDNPLRGRAISELHELRDLGIGRTAPQIVGDDHAGNPLMLRHYRGRVVVLSFFADWCGHCVKMYPLERELIARLDPRRFAILGVNVDPDLKTLRSLVSERVVTWPCWWDGADRAICKAWNVSGLPVTYVIDAAGVIRYKNVRGRALSAAVESLLAAQPVP